MTSPVSIGAFCKSLAAKQPTPGGGAAAAVGGAIGAAAASMSAAYTQRKKDIESGAAVKSSSLIETLKIEDLIDMADEDAAAYADLQRTWKEQLDPSEKAVIEARALAVPTTLVELCHSHIQEIHEFLPSCNSNITSDAKVGIHLLAGAARSAYQTVLVNSPPEEEKFRLKALLNEIRSIEDSVLD